MNTVRFNGEEVAPTKIVCVGRNYSEHIEELSRELPDQPVIFIKPNSSISNNVRSRAGQVIHYEGEISFLVRAGKIAGVGFGLDLTRRDLQQALQQKGLPWERAKSFDGAAVYSDFVSFDSKLSSLELELLINGQAQQRGGYELMIHKPEFLIKEIAGFLTLQDNDILMTGTPKGVGPLNPGDKLVGRVLSDGKILVEKQWVVE